MSFADLSLLPTLVESLAEQDITTPTAIQAQTIPALLGGTSVVGVAQTGSGKTLAYALPLLHTLKTLETEGNPISSPSRPRGVIVTPGRELGEQVSRVLKSLTHRTRLRVRVALGGSKKQVARQNVKGAFEILVATPGRLVQLMEGGELKLGDVRTLVFDEADRLLDHSFQPTAKRIVRGCKRAPQIAMFSATLPATLESAVAEICPHPPLMVRAKGSNQTVSTLKTDNRAVLQGERYHVLEQVLAEKPGRCAILFVNSHKETDQVSEFLDAEGLAHVVYRGEMDRQARRVNLAKFRSGEVNLLVTTDLGGRGLDIERVQAVINVFLPPQLDNYLHRVGRTARAGRAGTVINLVTQKDHPLIQQLKSSS